MQVPFEFREVLDDIVVAAVSHSSELVRRYCHFFNEMKVDSIG